MRPAIWRLHRYATGVASNADRVVIQRMILSDPELASLVRSIRSEVECRVTLDQLQCPPSSQLFEQAYRRLRELGLLESDVPIDSCANAGGSRNGDCAGFDQVREVSEFLSYVLDGFAIGSLACKESPL